jgi:hypothetical protein
MQKLAIIIGAIALLAGVAAAGTFASLGSSDTQPTISTEPLPATTRADDVGREDRRADRRDDRRKDRAGEARGRENEAGEDVRGRENEAGEDVRGREAEPNEDLRGPCDEAEHANDPRCTGAAAPAPRAVDDRAQDDGPAVDDRRGSNSGPGSSSGSSGHVEDSSGHGSGSDDNGSVHGGSGHGSDD